MADHIKQLQAAVLRDCQHYVKTKAALAIKSNNLFGNTVPSKDRNIIPTIPSIFKQQFQGYLTMSDVWNNVLKSGLGTNFIFLFCGYQANNTRVILHRPKRRRWQHGSNYRVFTGLEIGLIILSIATVSTIYTFHPSTPTQIQSKRCMRTCNLFSWGGC